MGRKRGGGGNKQGSRHKDSNSDFHKLKTLAWKQAHTHTYTYTHFLPRTEQTNYSPHFFFEKYFAACARALSAVRETPFFSAAFLILDASWKATIMLGLARPFFFSCFTCSWYTACEIFCQALAAVPRRRPVLRGVLRGLFLGVFRDLVDLEDFEDLADLGRIPGVGPLS